MKKIIVAVVFCSLLLLGCTIDKPTKERPVVSPPTTQLPPPPTPTEPTVDELIMPSQASLPYIKLEDSGASGELIGCNDSLVTVPLTRVTPFVSREALLIHLYGQLFAGQGLTNDLHNSVDTNLQVTSVAINAGIATVALSGQVVLGGACDQPRVSEQLTRVALQFPEITQVDITINGTPLDQYLSVE